jgi:hypothetical protein
MVSLISSADRFLHSSRDFNPVLDRSLSLRNLIAFVLVFGLWYGAVMGTFGGFAGDRVWQIAFSSSKVPLLLCTTFVLTLPSFYVLNILMGLGPDFGSTLRCLIAAQAGTALVLAVLAPYTALFYASTSHYAGAILFNAVMFGAASLTGQFLLVRFYRPLVERNERHRWMARLWIVVYAFVGIQMGWVLRPFIGNPSEPPEFVRTAAWSNAYVVILRLTSRVFGDL